MYARARVRVGVRVRVRVRVKVCVDSLLYGVGISRSVLVVVTTMRHRNKPVITTVSFVWLVVLSFKSH